MSEKKRGGMKSALDLAMERHGGDDAPKLSDAQKEALADIDSEVQAKIAELEIMKNQKAAAAQMEGEFGLIEALEVEHLVEVKKIRANGESRKEKIRKK